MTIPNILTILRLALVPVIVYAVIQGWYEAAFWLFVIAGISDGADGFIAKNFDQESELGAYLDPLADKALLVSLYIALSVQQQIPVWLAFLVVSRDLFIFIGIAVAVVMGRPMPIVPLMVSKATTVVQIALVAVILAIAAFGWMLGGLVNVGIILVTVLTLASALGYLLAWVRHMSDEDEN